MNVVGYVGQIIRGYLDEIKECFKPHVKLTFLARNPHVADGDILVTDDDLSAIIDAIKKAQAKEKR